MSKYSSNPSWEHEQTIGDSDSLADIEVEVEVEERRSVSIVSLIQYKSDHHVCPTAA